MEQREVDIFAGSNTVSFEHTGQIHKGDTDRVRWDPRDGETETERQRDKERWTETVTLWQTDRNKGSE